MKPSVEESLKIVNNFVARCSRENLTGAIIVRWDMRLGGVGRTRANVIYSTCYDSSANPLDCSELSKIQ